MEIDSSVLAWRIPWTEEPGELQSMQLQRVGQDWRDVACTQQFISSKYGMYIQSTDLGLNNRYIFVAYVPLVSSFFEMTFNHLYLYIPVVCFL